ncbi:MAG: T9SS type A sorting domain-containing protein [Bacteroidales bacterium]
MNYQIKNLVKYGVFSLILITSILNSVKAQEKKKEIVRVKVMCNDDGNVTSIDTSFIDTNMDITTIIESLNLSECGGSIGDINIDSLVNDALISVNIDSITDCIKVMSDEGDVMIMDDEDGTNGNKCKMIKIRLDGDIKSDTAFSFLLNVDDTLMEKEMKKIIIKKFDNSDKSESKEIKKKIMICKIIMLDTDKDDKKIIKKSVKNINNNTLEVEKLGFYPNPTSGKFKLDFALDTKEVVTIKILDVAGKEVYIEELKDFLGNYSKEIDISGNLKGIYFIIINQGDKFMSKKIVLE